MVPKLSKGQVLVVDFNFFRKPEMRYLIAEGLEIQSGNNAITLEAFFYRLIKLIETNRDFKYTIIAHNLKS